MDNKINVKLPTDEQVIEWLRKIKERCRECKDCRGCQFLIDGYCQIGLFTNELNKHPVYWDMEKTERIIKS